MSLWQSVVAEYIRHLPNFKAGGRSVTLAVQNHPMMQATNALALQWEKEQETGETPAPAALDYVPGTDLNYYLSHLGLRLGQAYADKNEALIHSLEVQFRKYSDDDPGFLTCAATYAEYKLKYKGVLKYNDWQTAGKGHLDYGVINYRLPNNAKVLILGDWGTGLDDAVMLLKQAMQQHQPDAVIHLGDIYYSGTPEECDLNFANVFDTVFTEVLGKNKRIPVFSIPGNHDYYAFAYGYYDMVTGLNSFNKKAVQEASYFCLKTEDDLWQFLGMDTGFDDANPLNQLNPYYAGPQLHASEVVWHKDKLERFGGATILLSHHQLFSSNARINGRYTSFGYFPFLNPYLLSYFQQYFPSKVAGWLWGHEHNLVLYKDQLCGLQKGRLVGCSAFEELASAEPYKVNNPEIPYLDPVKYRLSSSQGYYNHGYALIDFGTRIFPTDPINIEYYQYPSWGDTPPTPPIQASLVLREQLKHPYTPAKPVVQYGETVYLSLDNLFTYFSNTYMGNFSYYYPTVGAQPMPMQLKSLNGQPGTIRDGDTVYIVTLDKQVGDYNTLKAYATVPWLYYNKKEQSANEQWIIRKIHPNNDPAIRQNEPVYFISKAFADQYLTLSADNYLTTSASVPTGWAIAGLSAPQQETAVAANKQAETLQTT